MGDRSQLPRFGQPADEWHASQGPYMDDLTAAQRRAAKVTVRCEGCRDLIAVLTADDFLVTRSERTRVAQSLVAQREAQLLGLFEQGAVWASALQQTPHAALHRRVRGSASRHRSLSALAFVRCSGRSPRESSYDRDT